MYSSPCLMTYQLNVNGTRGSLYAKVSLKRRWSLKPVPQSRRARVISTDAGCADAASAANALAPSRERSRRRTRRAGSGFSPAPAEQRETNAEEHEGLGLG